MEFSNSIEGCCDAYTREPLDKLLGIYQCLNCEVYYHQETLLILQRDNNNECISCKSTNINRFIDKNTSSPSVDTTKTSKNTSYNQKPIIVTLGNYKQYEFRNVIFEGFVPKVRFNDRANILAIMFEDKPWNDAFKLIFFPETIKKLSLGYISNIEGRTIIVCGLITKHKIIGYHIVASGKSEILSIK